MGKEEVESMSQLTSLMKQKYGITRTSPLKFTEKDTLYTSFRKLADHIYKNGEWNEQDQRNAVETMRRNWDGVQVGLPDYAFFYGQKKGMNGQLDVYPLTDEDKKRLGTELKETVGYTTEVTLIDPTGKESNQSERVYYLLDPKNRVGTKHKQMNYFYDTGPEGIARYAFGNMNRAIGYDKLQRDILIEFDSNKEQLEKKGMDREDLDHFLSELTHSKNAGKSGQNIFEIDSYAELSDEYLETLPRFEGLDYCQVPPTKEQVEAGSHKEFRWRDLTKAPDSEIKLNLDKAPYLLISDGGTSTHFIYPETLQRNRVRNQTIQFVQSYIETTYHIALQQEYEQGVITQSRAKAWETKKNINDETKALMQSTTLRKHFRFVELDNEVDLDLFGKFEYEMDRLVEVLPKTESTPVLRLRKLGNYKALGLYNPFTQTIAVDFRDQTQAIGGVGIQSFVHEYAHFLDYTAGKEVLSLTPAFKEVLTEYEKNISKLPKDSYVRGKYSYYTTPSEVFARGFEVYVSDLGLTSILNKSPEMYTHQDEYVPFTSSMRRSLGAFFDTHFPDLRESIELYISNKQEIIVEKIPKPSKQQEQNQIDLSVLNVSKENSQMSETGLFNVPSVTEDPFGPYEEKFTNQLNVVHDFWREILKKNQPFEVTGYRYSDKEQATSYTYTPSLRSDVEWQLTVFDKERIPVSHLDITKKDINETIEETSNELLNWFPESTQNGLYTVDFKINKNQLEKSLTKDEEKVMHQPLEALNGKLDKPDFDNTRLGQAKRRLDRLEAELIARTKPNQSLENKEWFKTLEELRQEIEAQKERVGDLEWEADMKADGLDKRGELLMTVENIPRIKEEIARSEKGESEFKKVTINRYKKTLRQLEKNVAIFEEAQKNLSEEAKALIESGKVTQWNKNPLIYFVKGFNQLGLELTKEGVFQASEKYAGTTDKARTKVQQLLKGKVTEGEKTNSSPYKRPTRTNHEEREKLKQAAKSKSILDVANGLGMDLVQEGRNDFHWSEHDSFVLYPKKNYFYWNSQQVGGDPIKLVQTVKECTYSEAIKLISEMDGKEFVPDLTPRKGFHYFLQDHEDTSLIRNYLINERQLSEDTVNFFIDNDYISQANFKPQETGIEEPVVVFKNRNGNGDIRSITVQGIIQNKEAYKKHNGYLKKTVGDATTGLVVPVGYPPKPSMLSEEYPIKIYPIEAPIDLMSFYELFHNKLDGGLLTSMNGLRKSAVSKCLANYVGAAIPETQKEEYMDIINEKISEKTSMIQLYVATDNDKAGRHFVETLNLDKLKVTPYHPKMIEGRKKTDWNDWVKELKKPKKASAFLNRVQKVQPKRAIEFLNRSIKPPTR